MLGAVARRRCSAQNLSTLLPHVGRVFEIGRKSGKPVYREQVTFYRGGTERTFNVQVTRRGGDERGRREVLRRHGRRHHRPRLGAALLRLGRRGAAHRPRDQEPADPDPAVGRAHPAPLRQGDHRGPRGLRPVHRHDHPPGRRHRPHGRRVLGLRPHAEAGHEGRSTCASRCARPSFLVEVSRSDIAFERDFARRAARGHASTPADRAGLRQHHQERRRGDRGA